MKSIYDCEGDTINITADQAYTAGDIIQLPDGRAGQVIPSCISGELVGVRVFGVLRDVAKSANLVWIKGDPIWFDKAAQAATPLEPLGDSTAFYLGTAADDATAAAVLGNVILNVEPHYVIDSARDNGDTVIVKTVVGSTTVEVPQVQQRGGMTYMQFGTTAEAQKTDWLSARGFQVGSNWIVDILFELITAADAAAVDIDLGVASGTDATNFESVVTFAAFHLDGDDLNLDAHSDDGTTDKAPTDTTVDVVAGTPIHLKLDGRDPTDVKYYVNAVEKLAAEADLGNLAAASLTSYLRAILHAEKTADDSPLAFRARIRVRTQQ